MDKVEYVFQKGRKEFGRPVSFDDTSELLFSEPSNRETFRDYILQNPVTRATQCGNQMAVSEANTERATFKHCGIFHNEGGWPKDINMQDPEQTVR